MDGRMSILERKFAMYLLILLYEQKDPVPKATLVHKDKGKLFSKYARLDELEDAGLIKYNEDNRQYNSTLVSLTSKGEAVAEKLIELREMLPKNECTIDDY